MRKQGLILLGILIAVFALIYYLLSNRWLEGQMEALGSAVVGARVEFDDVRFSLTDLRLSWNRLQVTDPDSTMSNLFETAHCDLDIDLEPLIYKKLIIQNIDVEGLRFNTPRETDGRLTRTEREAIASRMEFVRLVEEHLRESSADMPVFRAAGLLRKVNVDSIWALLKLQSPGKIDSLRTVVEEREKIWQQQLASLPDRQALEALGGRVQALDPQTLKNVDDVRAALATAEQIKGQLQGYRQSLNDVGSSLRADVAAVSQYTRDIPAWIEKDYRRALQMARLPDLSVQNIAKLLFGGQLLDRYARVTRYVGTARYYVEKYQAAVPQQEKPPRLAGQTIYFGKHRELPKFWIQKAALSGEFRGVQLQGVVRNIVSNQKSIDSSMTIALQGVRETDRAALRFNADFDYRGEQPRELLALEFDNFSLAGTRLTRSSLLPSRIQSGKGKLSAKIQFEGNGFDSQVEFNGRNLRFDETAVSGQDSRLGRISRAITAAVSEVSFRANAIEKERRFQFKITSNLDARIAEQLKGLVSGELERARQELKNRVEAEIRARREPLERAVGQATEKVTAAVARVEEQLNGLDGQLASVQTRLKDELKKRLGGNVEEEAKKKLKNIFKKD